MIQIPVYVFTGFLDAGKTKFIQQTLEDPEFNKGQRTLLLVFEEGEEAYDTSTYPCQDVYIHMLDQQTVTTKQLQTLVKEHKAQRVVVELNGMQLAGDIYSRFPENWAVAQEVMFADATTFELYNANMRELVMDKLVGGQMVVFNRLEPGADTKKLHKIVRAANRRMEILYDYTDGTSQLDEEEDPLPYDIHGDTLIINDEDYAIFYRDITEEPEKYHGKTVCFKAQVANLRKNKEAMFAPGRFVMTCCVDDIQFCGIPCHYEDAAALKPRSWVMVQAVISAEKHALYHGALGPILTAIDLRRDVEPAKEDVVTF